MAPCLAGVGCVTGDVQPCLTLAIELRRHNHRPVLALVPEWRQRAEALEIEFVAIGPCAQIDMGSVMAATLETQDPFVQAQRFLDLTMPMVPQIDKPASAALAKSLGCAGPAIPHHRLTAERLGSAIAATLADARLKQAATRLGTFIRSERGVQTARELIEELVG